jgi:ribosomal protein L32
MEGRTMREHRKQKLEAVLADPNCPPLKLEYTQNILLPSLDPTVRFDPGDPSTHDTFMRTRGVAAPKVVGERFAVTNKDGSVTYHRIPNDPMQAPYLGQFRTGRALDRRSNNEKSNELESNEWLVNSSTNYMLTFSASLKKNTRLISKAKTLKQVNVSSSVTTRSTAHTLCSRKSSTIF